MITFDILTVIPEVIGPYAEASILGRAQQDGKIKIAAHNIRDWATDKHHTTDDTPYGGGPGMVMKVEPIHLAIQAVKGDTENTRVILTAANGKPFTQADAQRLAGYEKVIFVCGRYEGVDHRVEENLIDESFSIGPYVLTGGELPSLVMIDAIARNIPGVLGKQESLAQESHNEEGALEYPQYSKPESYNGWNVPEVLLSGNHGAIEKWRQDQSKIRSQNTHS